MRVLEGGSSLDEVHHLFLHAGLDRLGGVELARRRVGAHVLSVRIGQNFVRTSSRGAVLAGSAGRVASC